MATGVLSDTAETKILDHILRNTAWTAPSNIWVALGSRSSDAAFTELTGGSYARINMNDWTAASSRSLSNGTAITFATATADWGEVGSFGIFDASSGGTRIAQGVLDTPTVVQNTDTVEFAISALSVSVAAGAWSNYLANAILDHLFVNTAFTQPTQLNAFLAITDVTDSDTASTITEPSGGYSRQSVTFSAASGNSASNSTAPITFGTATGNWGELTNWGLIDQGTNVLVYGDFSGLGQNPSVSTNDVVKFTDAGDMTVSVD